MPTYMKTASAPNKKGESYGHLAIHANHDDGKVHFTAYRKNAGGDKVVTLGEYSIDAEELLPVVEFGKNRLATND